MVASSIFMRLPNVMNGKFTPARADPSHSAGILPWRYGQISRFRIPFSIGCRVGMKESQE